MPSPVAMSVVLSDDEREQLQAWVRRPKSAQALALRSRIVLACEGDSSNTQIARELGVTRGMVTKWRNRFAVDRLDGLLDQPRPGRPRIVEDARIEELITATLETAPRDATQWSTRSMAEHLGLSQSMVSRVWRAFGLAPHRQDSWKLSKDPLFVAKVRDVVGLYLNPPERALVLCVDEKTQIQALNRTAPVFPMLPGTPARASHDYVRHGTSSLYAALDLSTGKVIGALHSRHRASEFLAFLKTIEASVPADLDVHLVLDNASTHKTPAVKRWLLGHPRFVLHFTPTSSSWLNLVERWFAELTTKKLRRGTHTSVRQLNTDIRAGSKPGTTTPDPTSGPRPPTRSSPASAITANELMTQDTSSWQSARCTDVEEAGRPRMSCSMWPSSGPEFVESSCR